MDERNQNKIVHAGQCLRIQMSIYIVYNMNAKNNNEYSHCDITVNMNAKNNMNTATVTSLWLCSLSLSLSCFFLPRLLYSLPASRSNHRKWQHSPQAQHRSTCSTPGPGFTHLRIKNHAFGLVGLVGLVGLIVKPWHGQKIPEMEATRSHVAGEETGFDSSPTNLLGSQPSALWPARIFFYIRTEQ